MFLADRSEPTALVRRDGTTAETYGDKRGYSWQPFQAANRVAERHGAFGQQRISEVAAELLDELVEVCPWVTSLDGAAVDRYCRAEGRAKLLHAHVLRVASESGPDAVRPYLWSEASRAEANAQKFGEDIGLTPAGRAKLVRDLGTGAQGFAGAALDDLTAQGRALRLAAEQRLASGSDPPPQAPTWPVEPQPSPVGSDGADGAPETPTRSAEPPEGPGGSSSTEGPPEAPTTAHTAPDQSPASLGAEQPVIGPTPHVGGAP